MDQGLTSTCTGCGAEVPLESMMRLRDLTCPQCRQLIRPDIQVAEPSLVVIHGEEPGAVFPISAEMTFGRAPTNTLTLREMKASRQHASVRRNGSQFIAKDLKSANGTYVNGQLVSSRVLTSGDLLRIADTVFVFKNPAERVSVTSKLGARFGEGDYQTEAELKVGDNKQILTMIGGAAGSQDVGELQKANEKLRIIYDVTTFISSILDLEELLERLLDVVFEQIPAERGAIFLVSDQGELEQRVVKKRGAEVEERYMEISKTIISKVINELTSVLTTDTMQDESFSHAHSIISQGIRQAMTVPLIAREELLGLIHIDTTRMSRAFNGNNLQLLTGIAGQAAIAIQNAKLLDKIEAEVQTRSQLARYLAPELVDQVVNKELDLEMGGQVKKTTLLFSDLRGFTSLSERISAVEVVSLLNRYFEVMVEVIFEQGGMLDKFIGDAIMAVWGLPNGTKTDPERAVRAALDMQIQLYLLNFALVREMGEPMYMGIGINTGDVVNGNMGSQKRTEYTVIGSAVNLAARIESLTKKHQVLISENTYRELRDKVRVVELEPTTVKGISGEIKVFAVLGMTPGGEEENSERVDVFLPASLTLAGGEARDAVIVGISRERHVDLVTDAHHGVLPAGELDLSIDASGLLMVGPLRSSVDSSQPYESAHGQQLVRSRLRIEAAPDGALDEVDRLLFTPAPTA